MSLHTEINFEDEICQHLGNNGWLYSEGDAAGYDRAPALFPADVLAWVQSTQPKAWEVLTKNHGANAAETLLARLRDQIDQRGTLDVLRRGVELLGLRQPLLMAQFRPALAINPDILARFGANRLRVIRQVKYSLQHENCLDLVLFLNGIPVATAELKTDFTQSIGYVQVIRTKMLESQTLSQQAANNTKEQFANSPDLDAALMNAIVDALDAHTAMSTQAINKVEVRRGIKDILLSHARLWETLRERGAA